MRIDQGGRLVQHLRCHMTLRKRCTLAMQVNSKHSDGVTQAIVDMLRPHKALPDTDV